MAEEHKTFTILVSEHLLDDYSVSQSVASMAAESMRVAVLDEMKRRHDDREDQDRMGSDHD